VDWKKTRSRALGLGATLLALHASQSGALNAAASVGLYNVEGTMPATAPNTATFGARAPHA
jgi:hypothetical protein